MDQKLNKLLDNYEMMITGGYFVESKRKARKVIFDHVQQKANSLHDKNIEIEGKPLDK